jgi:hypothetical protein
MQTSASQNVGPNFFGGASRQRPKPPKNFQEASSQLHFSQTAELPPQLQSELTLPSMAPAQQAGWRSAPDEETLRKRNVSILEAYSLRIEACAEA